MGIRPLAALFAGLMVAVAACGSGASGKGQTLRVVSTPVPTVSAPESFVAVRPLPGRPGSQAVTVSNAHSGAIESVVIPASEKGMRVDGTAVDGSGRIWVTFAGGPRCAGSGGASAGPCLPQGNSCAGEVIRIDPPSGAVDVVLKASNSQLIGQARPSPDGKMLAYLDAPCSRSYFNQHVQVEDLASGRTWGIGTDLMVCHDLHSLGWAPDGQDLIVSYGASRLAGHAPDSYGASSCTNPSADQVALVPALRAASDLPGRRISLDAGCQADAVAATATGYAAIEACGSASDRYLTGPASLVRLSPALGVTSQTPIGACVDGAELGSNPAGTDLIGTTYQYCHTSGRPQPRTVTFTDTSSGVKTVIDIPNGGENAVSSVSW